MLSLIQMSDERSTESDRLAASIATGYAQIVGAAVLVTARMRGIALGSDVAIQAKADLSSDRMSIKLTIHVRDLATREIARSAMAMLPSVTSRGDLVLVSYTVTVVAT